VRSPVARVIVLGLTIALASLAVAASSQAATVVSGSKYRGDRLAYSPGTVDRLCGTGWGAAQRSTGGTWWLNTCWKGRALHRTPGVRMTTSYAATHASFSAFGWGHSPELVRFWCGRLKSDAQLLQLHVSRDRFGRGDVVSITASCR
jgi:hypothetical protein